MTLGAFPGVRRAARCNLEHAREVVPTVTALFGKLCESEVIAEFVPRFEYLRSARSGERRHHSGPGCHSPFKRKDAQCYGMHEMLTVQVLQAATFARLRVQQHHQVPQRDIVKIHLRMQFCPRGIIEFALNCAQQQGVEKADQECKGRLRGASVE